MQAMAQFLDSSGVALKVCGVTKPSDARRLVDLGVAALGVNFWPGSKRYVVPEAAGWLAELAGEILRVGVFVNAVPELPLRLLAEGWIDVIQLHGDETPEQAAVYRNAGVPWIKAIGVKGLDVLERVEDFGATAILLDAHAPGVYGGTGMAFDWEMAVAFKSRHPQIPLILAGGMVAENVAAAVARVQPVAVDVASGAEVSPGVKDFDKVAALLAALKS